MGSIALHLPAVVASITFLATMLFFLGIYQYVHQRALKRQLLEKLRLSGSEVGLEEELAARSRQVESLWVRLRSFLGLVGSRVGPADSSSRYSYARRQFLKAGLRNPSYPAMFWGVKGVLAFCLPLAFLSLVAAALEIADFTTVVATSVGLALLGFYTPDLWLRQRIATRKRRIFEGIPDALDLLVVCVEAGMALDAAMNRIAEEIRMTHEELSEELKLYNLEMRAGKARQDALANLAVRVDLEDMNALVTLLIQTDKLGTSLAKALRVYSDTFRTKRYLKAEEIAARLPTKLMVPLILFIFPALFVVIMGPAVIRIYQTMNVF